MSKKQPIILAIAIIVYIIFFTMLCFLKYNNFLYQELDLAIINQVFHNLADNNSFLSSIQNQNYLGDHFSPIIFILLPIYYFFQDPKTLLFLQTLILGLSAIPVYLIAKEKLKSNNLALITSLVFLAYPALHSVNLYEFSFLSFAVFFLLSTFYFLQKSRIVYFYIFIFLSLLVREDIALIIFMFGIFALIKKRSLKWVLPPVISSIIYFVLSLKVINHFNPEHTYKFLIHYSWLGQNLLEIIINLFLKFPEIILHLLNFNNLIFILYLLLPVLFLPIAGRATLIFLIPPFLQFGLANSGFKNIFFTHYLAIFVPFIFISAIYGLSRICTNALRPQISQINFGKLKIDLGRKEYILILFILIFVVLASNIGFSPSYNLPKRLLKINKTEAKTKLDLANKIPKCQCSKNYILATNDFLPALSNNENLFSAFYLIKGKKQYSSQKYDISKLNYALINYEQFFQICKTQEKIYNNQKLCKQAINRLDKLIKKNYLKIDKIKNNIIFYEQKYQPKNNTKILRQKEKEIIMDLSKQDFNVMLDESSLERINNKNNEL